MFRKKVEQKLSGILTYGITPPKLNTPPEKAALIAQKHLDRIGALPVDGLILYDLQDEKERNPEDRPFPFLPTIDPFHYAFNHLEQLPLTKIVYRSVGKYDRHELTDFLANSNPGLATVFVGAASKSQNVKVSLRESYDLYRETASSVLLGGVTIPERHKKRFNEHERISHKTGMGCSFFVSQAVYHPEYAKDMLSDYYYACRDAGASCAPIIFTLSPCGSLKTLSFMKWLGIETPRWLENDLLHARDMLETSLQQCLNICDELLSFCAAKCIPVGFNIESVSIRKEEIDASVRLTIEVHKRLKTLARR